MMAHMANEWSRNISGIFAPSETLFATWSGHGLMDGIGTDYAVTHNYMKTIAACRYVHGTIEAVERLIEDHGVRESQIASVDVQTYLPAALLDGLPHNTLSSKFSIPYAVLCAVRGRGYDFSAFHEPLSFSSQDYALMNSVRVLPSDDLTALLPDVRRTQVTLYLKGQVQPLVLDVDLPRGEWDRQLPNGAIETKWSLLMRDYPGTIDPSTLTVEALRTFLRNFIQSF